MIVAVFFGVVILFFLALCVWDKIKTYLSNEKSVWIDGDGIRVKKGTMDTNIREHQFMDRIA